MFMSLHSVVNKYGKVSRFLINGIFCLEECRFMEKMNRKCIELSNIPPCFPIWISLSNGPRCVTAQFPMSLHISQEIRQRKLATLSRSTSFLMILLLSSMMTNHSSKYKESRYFVNKYHWCQSQNSMLIGWGRDKYVDKVLTDTRR